MANKKTKNKKQNKPVEQKAGRSSMRAMQILFVVFSALIVLSMILAATASF